MRVNLNTTIPNQQKCCNPKPKVISNLTHNSSGVMYIPCISFGNALPQAVPFIYGAECNAGAKAGGVSAVVTDLAQYGYEFTPYYGGRVSEEIDTRSTLFNKPVTLESNEKYHPLKFKFKKTEVLRKIDPNGVERPVFIHPDKLYECGGDVSKVNLKDVQWLEEVCSKNIETASGKETAAIYKVVTLENGQTKDLPHKRFYVFTQGTGAMKQAYEGTSVAYSTGASVLGGADPYAINSKAFVEMLPALAEKGYHAKALLFNDPQTAYACEFIARKILENDPFYSRMVAGYVCHNPGSGYQAKSSFKAMFLNFATKAEIDMIENNLLYQKIKHDKFLEEQFFATFMPDLVDAKGGTSGLMLALRYRENGLLNYLGTVAPGAAKSYCLGAGEADGVKFLMKSLFEKGMFQGILNGLNNDGIDPRKEMALLYYNSKKIADAERDSAAAVAKDGKGEVLKVPDEVKKDFETFDPDAYEKGLKQVELADAKIQLDEAREKLPDGVKKAYENLDNANADLTQKINSKQPQEVIDNAKKVVENAQKELEAQTTDKFKTAETNLQAAKDALAKAPDSLEAKNALEQAQKELLTKKSHDEFLQAKKHHSDALTAFQQTEASFSKLKVQIEAKKTEAVASLEKVKTELAGVPDFKSAQDALNKAQLNFDNAEKEYFANSGLVDKQKAYEVATKELNTAEANFAKASKLHTVLLEAQNAVDDASESELHLKSMIEEQNSLDEAFKKFDEARKTLKQSPDSADAKQAFNDALEKLNAAKKNISTQFDLTDIVNKKQRNAANLFTRINLAQESGHPEYVLGKKIAGARIWGDIDPKYIKRITSPNKAERQMVDLFVCWGRADEQKGLDIAIESFRRFVEESTEAYKSGKTATNAAENAVLVMGGPIGDSYPALRDAIRNKVAETLSKDYMKGRFVFLDGFAPNSVLASACTFDITPSRWAPCELVDHEARKFLGLPIVTGIEGLDDKNFDIRYEKIEKPTGYKTAHNNLTSIEDIKKEVEYKKSMQTYDSAMKYTDELIKEAIDKKQPIEIKIRDLINQGKESETVELKKQLAEYNAEIAKQQRVKAIIEERNKIKNEITARNKEFLAIKDEFDVATEKQHEATRRFLDILSEKEVPADRAKAISEIETTLKQTEQTIAKARTIQQKIAALETDLSNVKANLQKTSGKIIIVSERTQELLDAYFAELTEFKEKLIKNLKQKRVFADKEGKLFTVIAQETIDKEVEAAVIENLEIKSGEKAILAPKRQAVIDSMTNDDLVEIFKDTTRLTQDERFALMSNNHNMKIRWENNAELQRIWVPGHYEGSVWKEGHFVKTDLAGKSLYELCFNGETAKPKNTFVNFSYQKLMEAQEKILKIYELVGEKTDELLPPQTKDKFVSGTGRRFKHEKGLTFAEKYMTKQTALIAGGAIAVAGLAYYLFAPKKDNTETASTRKKHPSSFIA